MEALVGAVKNSDAQIGAKDEFGTHYGVDFLMQGPKGSAIVRSVWIIRTEDNFPRLVSCYVL